jgi:hypothetical protein
MDELIILLIKGIAKMLGGDQPKKPGQFRPPASQVVPGNIPPALLQRQQEILRAAGARRRKPAGRRPVAMPAPVPTQLVEVVPDAPPTSARAAAAQRAAPSSLAAARKPAVTVNATAIHSWLTPSVLQKQFILTEIFQPPLALREER